MPSENGGMINSAAAFICALPGGYRNNSNGSYDDMDGGAYFWSANESNSYAAWYRYLNYYFSDVTRVSSNKRNGFTVRLVRD